MPSLAGSRSLATSTHPHLRVAAWGLSRLPGCGCDMSWGLHHSLCDVSVSVDEGQDEHQSVGGASFPGHPSAKSSGKSRGSSAQRESDLPADVRQVRRPAFEYPYCRALTAPAKHRCSATDQKNYYTCGVLGMLVRNGRFSRTHMRHLVASHGHEMIDRCVVGEGAGVALPTAADAPLQSSAGCLAI